MVASNSSGSLRSDKPNSPAVKRSDPRTAPTPGPETDLAWTSFWPPLKAVFPSLRPPLSFQPPALSKALQFDQVPIYLDKRLGKCGVAMRWALWKGLRCKTGPVKNILVICPISAMPDWLREIEADGQVGMLWKGVNDLGQRTIVNGHLLQGVEEEDQPPIFFLCNKESTFKPKGRGGRPCQSCDGKGEIQETFNGKPSEKVECDQCDGKGKIPAKYPEPVGPLNLTWDAVIIDEPESLRTPNSQFNWICQNVIAKRVHYRAILSGEPAPNGPMQYFEQMKFLYGSFMGETNFWNWRDEYFQQVGYEWVPKKGALTAMREAVQARAVILTRKQAGLANVRTYEHRYCDLPPKVRKEYDQAEKLFVIGGQDEVTCVLPVQTHLARLAGGFPPEYPAFQSDHKIKIVLELLKGEYSNEPIIIVFRFNQELVEVSKALKKVGIESTYITGETPVEERGRRMQKFRQGQVRIMLAQIKAFKFGIDASVSSTMFLYSVSYSPDDLSQCMDRMSHPAKKDPLHYIWVIASNTKDQDVMEAYEDKKINARIFFRIMNEKQKARVEGRSA